MHGTPDNPQMFSGRFKMLFKCFQDPCSIKNIFNDGLFRDKTNYTAYKNRLKEVSNLKYSNQYEVISVREWERVFFVRAVEGGEG